MSAVHSPAFKILLVEDNPADADLVKRALGESRFSPQLSVVENGAEALDFLQQKGTYQDARRPDLIMLDLNIPGKDGHQILGELKLNPELKEVPILIYTSSAAHIDVKISYRLGANAYVRKPAGMDEFFSVISAIENFWFGTALLPSTQR